MQLDEYDAHFYTDYRYGLDVIIYVYVVSILLVITKQHKMPNSRVCIQSGKTQPSISNISRNFKMFYISLSHSELFRYIRLELRRRKLKLIILKSSIINSVSVLETLVPA
jgi:hypothetical protein